MPRAHLSFNSYFSRQSTFSFEAIGIDMLAHLATKKVSMVAEFGPRRPWQWDRTRSHQARCAAKIHQGARRITTSQAQAALMI
jgi:hypothetical protein